MAKLCFKVEDFLLLSIWDCHPSLHAFRYILMDRSLARILRSASSQSAEEVKAAEQHLQQLAKSNGFYSNITKIIFGHETDDVVRFQAALYLKNNVDLIWRKNRIPDQFCVSDEEKSSIRNELLSRFDETNDQINLQVAVIIGKIARLDCPVQWPELIPRLSDVISLSDADSLIHNRALLVLYHVVKVLVSKRLAADKRRFHMLSGHVFNSLAKLWRSHYEKCTTSFAHASSGLLCLKILRYVVNFGFNKHQEVHDVKIFMDELPVWIRHIFNAAISCQDNHLSEKLSKMALLILKMVAEFQDMQNSDFVYWLPSWLEICYYFVFSDEVQELQLTALKIRSINLLKYSLMCEDYKGCQAECVAAPDLSYQAADIRSRFFDSERSQRMCYVLIRRYLMLTNANLEQWHDEPEIFATVDDTQSWLEILTPAAESFFVALVHECWHHLRTVVPSWLYGITQQLDYKNSEAVLERDSLLVALGLAANDLYEEIDFDTLFTNVFLPLLSETNSNDQGRLIIRKRVLWICGKWVSVKFSKPLRPQLYAILIKSMVDNKDIVLRLTACSSFKSSIDDFDFDLEQFRPFIESSVAALVQLLKSCCEPDAQMIVVTTLWLLTEHVGVELRNSIEPIVSYAPKLWNSDHNMLKCQILNLFTQLVKSLKSSCVCLLDGLCEILPAAVDVSMTSHVYLLEEGLDLWLALLENCSSPLPDRLLSLFKYIPDLMTMQSENLKMCCEIVKAYCAYMSEDFLRSCLRQFGDTVVDSIDDLINEGKVTFLKTIEMVIRCYKTAAFQPLSGMITWCVRIVMENQEMASVLVLACSVLALVAVHDVRQLYNGMLPLSEQKISNFLTIWLQKITLTTHDLERRKLFGLGFCAWLTVSCNPIDEHFSDIVLNLSEIIRDVCTEEDGVCVDSLVAYDFGAPLLGYTSVDGGALESEHDRRMQMIRDNDPIYTQPLHTVVVSSFHYCQQSRGTERFGQLWSSVDNEALNELRKMIRM